MRICCILMVFLLLLHCPGQSQQVQGRPKIGLTLSGGGAKGLAHIGILKAIDSAGLNVDYITGTSMGSIIGSLYAVGYSADTIEKIARTIDWDLLLSNQSSLRSVFMDEKDEYSKYVVELPWVNHRFRLATGILEAQELWLKLSELFFPVSHIKDFSRFSIPFKCVATDVGTGEAVVMESGEIVSSVRSSMAIPTLFTAVKVDNRHLIDGGVIRNFPVQDVKSMGADIVVGSNVSTGLLSSDQVRNPLQVLLQVAFYREAEDQRTEVPLCDIYVDYPLKKYNMGSFGQAMDILEVGIRKGEEIYPRLKELADSLNALYGDAPLKQNRLPGVEKVKISSFEISGLKNTSIEFFINTLDLFTGKWYSAKEISGMIRHAFGTRYYNRILYSLHEQPDGSYKIIFDVMENPLTFAKLGLHYDKFSGISAIVNFTSRNFITSNSRSLLTVNIGDNFRVKSEHLQYIGRHKSFSFSLGAQYDRFSVNTYDMQSGKAYRETGLYRRQYSKLYAVTGFSSNRKLATGLGFRMEFADYKPVISGILEIEGNNNFPTVFTFLKYNTLNKRVFPTRGMKVDMEIGRVLKQNPSVSILKDGQSADPGEYPVARHPYQRALLDIIKYSPVSHKITLLTSMQSGINLDYSNNVMNEFSIGGMVRLYDNQIVFAGLPEATTYAASVAAFTGGLRYELLSSVYLTGKANVLFTNMGSRSIFFNNPDFFSGYALTFGYNFALGPLEVSAMYSDQLGRVSSYVSLGISF
ncbi:MAG: patatin-like phospholipase family protein [Chitinophagaceae bacterium]|nr:patatin-like phospholipase family protein [Chitinophagaceae bacterium]